MRICVGNSHFGSLFRYSFYRTPLTFINILGGIRFHENFDIVMDPLRPKYSRNILKFDEEFRSIQINII